MEVGKNADTNCCCRSSRLAASTAVCLDDTAATPAQESTGSNGHNERIGAHNDLAGWQGASHHHRRALSLPQTRRNRLRRDAAQRQRPPERPLPLPLPRPQSRSWQRGRKLPHCWTAGPICASLIYDTAILRYSVYLVHCVITTVTATTGRRLMSRMGLRAETAASRALRLH